MNRKLNRLASLGLTIIVFCLGTGCAVQQGTVYIKDGKRYGVISSKLWRSRWWNHYERGLSYADGEYWDDAIADFQAAIRQREQDQRRARTYGLHFIDYFPHRELGVIYYHLGRYREALRELEVSLAHTVSAKANVYLNRARREWLQQTGQDRAAPRLRLDGPADGLVTNRFSITVSGQAEDDTYVAAIIIQGQKLFIELAEPQVAFSHNVALRDGLNRIGIVAEDLLGNQTRQEVEVWLDRQGPLLSIDHAEVTGTPPGQLARIQGFLSDHSKAVHLNLAGQAILQPAEQAFQYDVPILTGAVTLPFEAVDAAGNVTRGAIALTRPAPVRQGKMMAPPWVRWASSPPGTTLIDTGSAPWAVTQLTPRHVPLAPVITIHDLTEGETIFDHRLYLTGKVVDATGEIKSFAINNRAFLRHQKSQQFFFGEFFPLQEGPNSFRLEAMNQKGDTASHTINVKRELTPDQQIESRLRVSLLPLEKKGKSSDLSEAVDERLLATLVKQRRFDLVERVKLKHILQEHKLSQTSLVDPDAAIQLGKLLNAEGMLIGSVIEKDEPLHSLEVFIRFVDVETLQIHDVIDVYDDAETGKRLPYERLRTLIEGLAWKLKHAFPLVDGWVLAKEEDIVLIDLNQEHGIRPQMKLIVFREGKSITHPITGRLLQAPGDMVGEARVKSVSKDLSEATLLFEVKGQKMQQNDKVITK